MDEIAEAYETQAHTILRTSELSDDEARVIAILLQVLSIHIYYKKSLTYLFLMDSVLTAHPEAMDSRGLLRTCGGFARFKTFGREDRFRKWIDLTIKKAKEEKGQDQDHLKVEAAAYMFKAQCYSEAKSLIDSCVVRDGLCLYFMAVYHWKLGARSLCEPLFRLFIQNSLFATSPL